MTGPGRRNEINCKHLLVKDSNQIFGKRIMDRLTSFMDILLLKQSYIGQYHSVIKLGFLLIIIIKLSEMSFLKYPDFIYYRQNEPKYCVQIKDQISRSFIFTNCCFQGQEFDCNCNSEQHAYKAITINYIEDWSLTQFSTIYGWHFIVLTNFIVGHVFMFRGGRLS